MFWRVGMSDAKTVVPHCIRRAIACGFALSTPSLCTARQKHACTSGLQTNRCFLPVGASPSSSPSPSSFGAATLVVEATYVNDADDAGSGRCGGGLLGASSNAAGRFL